MNEHFLNPERISLVDELNYPISGIIIADAKLKKYYRGYFERKDGLPTLYLTASERRKNKHSLHSIYDFLTKHNLKRNDIVHIFGGGVICDLSAYAVATFKRGCRLKLYPTTLLAMVDAAIGGKCAINYQGFKNHIGTFYPAEEITIFPSFLQTLDPIELRQGKAEMLKCYYIAEQLSPINIDPHSIPEASQILEYAKFKMDICAQDPHDSGIRRILNFGHTFGHAYESLYRFKGRHGEFVIAGMIQALHLSKQGNMISDQIINQYDQLFKFPISKRVSRFVSILKPEDLWAQVLHDKKIIKSGFVTMVLVTGYRKVEIKEITIENTAV
jgi:3-dehydroquinate synthase